MAFLAAALPYIQAASAVVGAASAIQAGRAQAQSMRLQAAQAELQGRQNALNYNRQAMQVLERQNRLAGTIRARAAAAGVDPFTGSPLTLQQVNALTAGREAQIAQENAQMAIYGGLAQSQSLQAAAGFTERQAFIGALSNAALQGYAASRTATPGSGTTTLAPVETRMSAPAAAQASSSFFSVPSISPSAPIAPAVPATSYPVR